MNLGKTIITFRRTVCRATQEKGFPAQESFLGIMT